MFDDGPSDEEFGDEEEEEQDSEEDVRAAEKRKKPAVPVVRQRWDEVEMNELNTYFKTYLDSKVCPNTKAVRKAKQQSKVKNGKIWMRSDDKIIKKISNLNHKS